jgi:hypothetical protein
MESARVPRWAARIKSLGDLQAFYARSLSVDELGTTAILLEWRDNLVEAGWNGSEIAGGGERLWALAAIEAHDPTQTSLGRADRLVRIERALERAPVRIYDSLELLEDAALWPRRWQNIFTRFADRGTSILHHTWSLPGAPADSDLGLLQARLRGERREGTVRGDGTLLFLHGDTPDDLAELTAALLAKGHIPTVDNDDAKGSDVVVRCLEAASLEAALVRQGLPAQGSTSDSVWRPAMQALPLAIELAFAPRDPHRVLELLTLPLGPLRGSVGARLARAVARQPGIGGKEWTRQKAEAARRLYERHVRLALEEGASEGVAGDRARVTVADRMKVVEVWLEGPVAAETGATRAELLAPATRVLTWLQRRMREGDVETYGAAYAQCTAFIEALGHDTRETFSQDDARQLVDHFARSEQPFGLSEEAAGRLGHVNHPAALLAPCDRVWMWCFVSAVERQPTRFRWDDDECEALRAAGVTFADPTAVFRSEAASWRRALLAARERVVLIVPRTIKGTATAPHPVWDEIRARLALEEHGAACLIRDARRLLDGPQPNDVVRLATCSPLHLPQARGEWRVPAGALRSTGDEGTMSVTSLEKIATCPLAWVFEHRANLRAGTMSSVATGPILNGNLGHRLIEELHLAGAFELSENAARDLYRYLAQRGYRIAAVEEPYTRERRRVSRRGLAGRMCVLRSRSRGALGRPKLAIQDAHRRRRGRRWRYSGALHDSRRCSRCEVRGGSWQCGARRDPRARTSCARAGERSARIGREETGPRGTRERPEGPRGGRVNGGAVPAIDGGLLWGRMGLRLRNGKRDVPSLSAGWNSLNECFGKQFDVEFVRRAALTAAAPL